MTVTRSSLDRAADAASTTQAIIKVAASIFTGWPPVLIAATARFLQLHHLPAVLIGILQMNGTRFFTVARLLLFDACAMYLRVKRNGSVQLPDPFEAA